MSFRITSRGSRANQLGGARVPPSVRFRRAGLQHKIEKNKSNVRRYAHARPAYFNFLTPAGLATIGSLFVAVIALAWFFIFSAKFLINNVTVAGGTTLTQPQINQAFYKLQDKRILGLVPGNHYLFLNKAALRASLQELFPQVAEVSQFKRKFPNELVFAISEKIPTFLLLAEDGRYLLDGSGVLLGEAVSQIPPEIVVLEHNLAGSDRRGRQIISVPVLNFARGVQKNWPAEWVFKPNEYAILEQEAAREFKIVLNEGWYIKADGDGAPEDIIKNLKVLLENEIGGDEKRQQLAYVDLRLPNRAFYCLKASACAKER